MPDDNNEKLNLLSVVQEIALLEHQRSYNQQKSRIMKSHSGPPVSIRCKCGHPKRYHFDPFGLQDFTGGCRNCKCLFFRKRD